MLSSKSYAKPGLIRTADCRQRNSNIHTRTRLWLWHATHSIHSQILIVQSRNSLFHFDESSLEGD
jgi:argininosuccinate lyase